ncbi:MAG: MBL fold metallo-hydrolase [Candidatus Thorarchaeota archaeon]|nr:MBL fold metallo-hydrolase [Candidatus Thorarchaeota archaeon]
MGERIHPLPLVCISLYTSPNSFIQVAMSPPLERIRLARAIEEVEIRVLADSNVQARRAIGEAGFAALVTIRYDDMSEFQFLFDTAGGTPALEHNVGVMKEQINRDLSEIELIVLSHGHWDHVAGLLKVLDITGKPVRVLCHPDALLHKIFTEKSGKTHEIGIHQYYTVSELESRTKIIRATEPYKIADGIMTTGVVPRKNSFEKLTGNLLKITTEREGKMVPDLIEDDLSVVFHMKDGKVVVLTGCCHSGVVNTVEHAAHLTGSSSITSIVGGLHLLDASKERLSFTVESLRQYPLSTIGACHCTGLRGRAALMYASESVFKDVGATSVLKFQAELTE